jgi:hypothetical protein
MTAEVDPAALTIMASIEAGFAAIDDNLARAQSGDAQLDGQRARERAERERAAINEPVIRAEPQAVSKVD